MSRVEESPAGVRVSLLDGASSSRPPLGPSAADSRSALGRLVFGVIAVVLIALATHTTNLLVVIVALAAMIMLHELGHFTAAKLSGMKVTEYFLGFGPRIWSVRRGETEYGVKALPLGGYVKIVGMSNLEQVETHDEPRTYRAKPFRNRLAVGLAGSFMHFVMAYLLLWGAVVFAGTPAPGLQQVASLSDWTGHATPAQMAGLRPGDVIVSIAGQRLQGYDQMVRIIGDNAGRAIAMVVQRDGRTVAISITPADGHDVAVNGSPVVPASDHAPGRIGVQLQPALQTGSPLVAFGRAATLLGSGTLGVLTGIGHTFSPHGLDAFLHDVTNAHAAQQAAQTGDRPESIVGAVQTATQGAAAGSYDLIAILVSIILVIGIINLFPMLPLDGGHVVIAVYERVRSRRGRPYHADVNKLAPVAYVVVTLLVALFLSSLYLDLTHPIQNPFK